MKKEDRIICRCEEVLESEIRAAVKSGCTTLRAVKIRTRAGMGSCQGNSCSLLIRRIISEMTGIPLEEIDEDTARFPAYITGIGIMAGNEKKL